MYTKDHHLRPLVWIFVYLLTVRLSQAKNLASDRNSQNHQGRMPSAGNGLVASPGDDIAEKLEFPTQGLGADDFRHLRLRDP